MNQWRIIREIEDMNKTFSNLVEAFQWLQNNTGYFDSNETVAVINWNTAECHFYKMQTKIVVEKLT